MKNTKPALNIYYENLVKKKLKENSNLKEVQNLLSSNIKFLRKSITFLEYRKLQLESNIEKLKKEIFIGIDIVQKLKK